MSALDRKQKSAVVSRDVRYWPKADISAGSRHVRFLTERGLGLTRLPSVIFDSAYRVIFMRCTGFYSLDYYVRRSFG